MADREQIWVSFPGAHEILARFLRYILSMSFFTIIFLILVFWWVIRPIWRVATAVNRARRQAQQMADAFSGQSRQRHQQPQERKAGWSTPMPHKKHVGKDVGEYVAFEEVSASETTPSTKSGNTRTDSFHSETWERVTDADWEEIQ